jgi:cytochrome c6
MKTGKRIILSGVGSFVIAAMCVMSNPPVVSAAGKSGQELFKEHCAVCHPDGGNIVNPEKTLHKKALEANNVKTAAEIVNKMRNPGPGMQKFDSKTVSDSDAKKIAEYILSTFNK